MKLGNSIHACCSGRAKGREVAIWVAFVFMGLCSGSFDLLARAPSLEKELSYGEYSVPLSRVLRGNGLALEVLPETELSFDLSLSRRMNVEGVSLELFTQGGYPIDAAEYLKKIRINGRGLTPEALELARERTTEFDGGVRVYIPSLDAWEEGVRIEIPDPYLLDVEASRITVGGKWLRVDLNLSMLNDLLREKGVIDPHMHYCFPGELAITPEVQELGSLVTQGLALRYVDTMPAITVDTELSDSSDNIVIGKYDQVLPFLGDTPIESMDGAYLEIREHPKSPHRFLIIVSGADFDQIRDAACMLGLVWTPLPEASGFSLSDLQFPETPIHLVRGPMYPNQVYPFKDIGFRTRSARVGGDEAIEVEFRFSAEVPFHASQRLEMDLRLSQTSRTRQSVDLELLINGVSRRGKTFQLKPGPEMTVDTWRIPMSDFVPGLNRLTIIPQPQGGADNRLRISLDQTSRVRVPGPSSDVNFPDLGLLAVTAHPLANVPDGGHLQFMLAHPSESSAKALWLFAGEMAQISGTLLYNALYSDKVDETRNHLVAIGRLDLVKESLLEDSLLRYDDLSDLSYVLNYKEQQRGWLPRAYDQMMSTWADEGEIPDGWSLSDEGMIYQFSRLTMDAGYSTVTLITTGPTGDIGELMEDLMLVSNWEKLDGEVAVWRPGSRGQVIARGVSSEAVRDGTHYDSKLPYFSDLRFGQWMTWISVGLIVATLFGRMALEHVYRTRI